MWYCFFERLRSIMFFPFSLLLVSQLLLMSDREHFGEPEKLSENTEIAWDDVAKKLFMDIKQLENKKVLCVVHGFNNTAIEAIQSYRIVSDRIASLIDVDGKPFYDLVIGYLWPGYDDKLEYYMAREHAVKLKEKMLEHLRFLALKTKSVDVMAHSMGNRLVFEALNFPPKKNAKSLIQNLYSLAAAIDNESIEKNNKYFHTSKNCNQIFIFHSNKDEVLKFLYTIAEWDKALGLEGVEDLKMLPDNVQLIDCTSFVSRHNQYFGAAHVYGFIRSQLLKQVPSAKNAPQLTILANGDIEKNEPMQAIKK